MKLMYRLVFVLMLLQLAAGCTTAPTYQTELTPGALNENSIGIAWLSRCHYSDCIDTLGVKGNFTPNGVSGLLDMAIVNSSHGYLEGEVQKLDATDIVSSGFLSKVSFALQERGISAPVSESAISPQTVKISRRITGVILQDGPKGNRVLQGNEVKTRRVNQLQMDLQPVADELNTEQILVLEMLEYGVRRNFGPFAIPVSPSYAVAAVRGFLLDTQSGETLLNDYAYYELVPDYTNGEEDEKSESRVAQLMSTVDEALELAIGDVTNTLINALNAQAGG